MNYPLTAALSAAVAIGLVAGCSTGGDPVSSQTVATITHTAETPGPVTTETVKAATPPAVTKTVVVTVTKKAPAPVAKKPAPAESSIPLDTSDDLEKYGDLYEPENPSGPEGSGVEPWMSYTAPDWSGGAPKWWKQRIDYYYDFSMCGSIESILDTLPQSRTDIRAIIIQEGGEKGTCN